MIYNNVSVCICYLKKEMKIPWSSMDAIADTLIKGTSKDVNQISLGNITYILYLLSYKR